MTKLDSNVYRLPMPLRVSPPPLTSIVKTMLGHCNLIIMAYWVGYNRKTVTCRIFPPPLSAPAQQGRFVPCRIFARFVGIQPHRTNPSWYHFIARWGKKQIAQETQHLDPAAEAANERSSAHRNSSPPTRHGPAACTYGMYILGPLVFAVFHGPRARGGGRGDWRKGFSRPPGRGASP